MRSVLVYEKSSSPIFVDIAHAIKRAWPELTMIALPPEDPETLDGQRLVVLPGYDISITIGTKATERCVADWQATQICYVIDGPQDAAQRFSQPCSTSSSEFKSDAAREKCNEPDAQIRLVREHRDEAIRWDRFDPMTYHIAASPEVWNKLPARSIRRVEQVVPPPIDTDFFQPGESSRDEIYLCIYEDSNAGNETIAEACHQAGRQLVVATYANAGAIPTAVADRSHVEICEVRTANDLRDQFRRRRALVMSRSGWSSTVLEAQACGMPVILAPGKPNDDAQPLNGVEESLLIDMEETEPGSGLCCDEHSAACICSAIRELERRPQRFSPSLAWAHAARHSPHCFGRSIKHLAEQIRQDDLKSSSLVRRHWKRAG